jgi:hypothetical protein
MKEAACRWRTIGGVQWRNKTMIDKAHLQGKTIAVRISSLDRAVSATVSYMEQDGIWFVGSEVVGQVTTNGGGMPLGLKTPAVYVPFSQIRWLAAENQ